LLKIYLEMLLREKQPTLQKSISGRRDF
jgi:hypothetical protein